MSTIIGYIFDKKGNTKPVYAPINSKGKEILVKPSTSHGQIGDNVGFSTVGSNKK